MDSHGDIHPVQSGSDHVDTRGGSVRSDLSGLYHLGRTLGRGHFAIVKLARHVSTGQLVAVKMIDKTKLDIMARSHLLQEVRCMRLVQHPNVVRLYEVIDTPTTLYLIMELAEGGDLYDYILRHEGGVVESTAKRHFAQIVRAVAYCHQLHVVHRDLKPENVVFFPQQGAVKLTDFGFSNLFKPGMMLATSCGSLAYSAPEILLGEEYDAPAVDIWSLGVILYMLVCGVPPFQETNDSETLVMILDCRYSVPEHVSSDCRDLISSMLQKDPSCRASLKEVEAHEWLQGLENALLSPEAPPHWLSGALSPISHRPGVPESGDLLAARPPPQKVWRPSLSLSLHPPPPEEPAVVKTLAALQQICEEGEEEEEDSLNEEGEGSPSKPSLVAVAVESADDQGEDREEEEPRIGNTGEVIEGRTEEKIAMEIGAGEGGHVISDQPSSEGHKPVTQTSEVPLPQLPGLAVQCCQGEPDPTTPERSEEEEAELNNNTNKPHPLLIQDGSQHISAPSHPLPSPRLSLNGKGPQRTGRGGKQMERTEEGERDDLQTDRSQPHSAVGSRDAGPDAAAPRAESGKRHSIKLRERLFQFPLCEKALAFNIPTHKKSKILPLAQYNCCHVL
ncbi:SNF related kinase b [Genypterus blacodes]|uniref:SNF related kinase b n=1 Tax=Genypterus blacodes TaxID=154954 RepID=UPI003F76674F